ncbi:MAG: hypothetical protein KC588_11525 [Nitrospira sp.]|nr:hypothetical protein [Nitrospira sp.]
MQRAGLRLESGSAFLGEVFRVSHVRVITLPKVGKISIVCKPKRDISIKTPFVARDDESLGWGYWDRIWPFE